jgi:chromate reductase
MKILAISGSLRAASTNMALLRAARRLAPPGMIVSLYDGLGHLPIFNPDDDIEPGIPAVEDFRRRLRQSDGVLVACPEYAHGVPGGLKNALDWIVASGELVDKPMALFHASARSDISRQALAEILVTMSARLIREATVTVPLLGRNVGEMDDILIQPGVEADIRAALVGFATAVGAMRQTVAVAG